MTSKARHRLLSMITVLTAGTACTARFISAQTLQEHSAEARFQLDLHVPDAALAAFLPTGWTPNVAAQGPAKDANLRVIFIDRMTINGPDGKPLGKGDEPPFGVPGRAREGSVRHKRSADYRRPDSGSSRCSWTVWQLPASRHAFCATLDRKRSDRTGPRFSGLGVCDRYRRTYRNADQV